MLCPVDVLLPHPEEGVRDDAWVGRVAEAAVNKGHSQRADQQAKAEAAETCSKDAGMPVRDSLQLVSGLCTDTNY